MAKMSKAEAKRSLEKLGMDFKKDFHIYSFRFATELTEYAKKTGYRQPKNANGSLARCFFYHIAKCG